MSDCDVTIADDAQRLCPYGCGRRNCSYWEHGTDYCVGEEPRDILLLHVECQALTISRLNAALNAELRLRVRREEAIENAGKWQIQSIEDRKRNSLLEERLNRISATACGEDDR